MKTILMTLALALVPLTGHATLAAQIIPKLDTVAGGTTIAFFGVGGRPPYKFSLNLCPGGSIHNGIFKAPVMAQSGFCYVIMQDAYHHNDMAAVWVQGPTGQSAFLQNLYGQLLQRQAGSEEVAAWLSIVSGANMSCSQLAVDILGSQEFANVLAIFPNAPNGNKAFINLMYRSLLDRIPSNDETQAWASLLNSGTLTRKQVADGFLQAPEFSADCTSRYGFSDGAGAYSSLQIN